MNDSTNPHRNEAAAQQMLAAAALAPDAGILPQVVECPWPIGTVLRSTGYAFVWIFEHCPGGAWYEMGNERRRDWAYVANLPDLVELKPAADPNPLESAEYRAGMAHVAHMFRHTVNLAHGHSGYIPPDLPMNECCKRELIDFVAGMAAGIDELAGPAEEHEH